MTARRSRHILTSHEQGAAHAADGYARSTGKVGVCFATSGPGATNLTTGIATAYMDSSSVVFISCNVPQNLIGRDAFQEVDITGITMPITKSTYLVRDVTKLADTVREAFALARSGRPGPVVIDITRDVTSRRVRLRAAASGAARCLRASGILDPPGLHQQPENAGGGSGRRGKAGGDDRGIQKAHADLRRRRGPQPGRRTRNSGSLSRRIDAPVAIHRDGWRRRFRPGRR